MTHTLDLFEHDTGLKQLWFFMYTMFLPHDVVFVPHWFVEIFTSQRLNFRVVFLTISFKLYLFLSLLDVSSHFL